jgi:putative iron-only hydrogenase system regulator
MDEKRLCLINIIVEERGAADKVNAILSDFGDQIIGRLGLPVKERGVFVITVVADAESKIINSVTGKLGMLSGVSAKTLMR